MEGSSTPDSYCASTLAAPVDVAPPQLVSCANDDRELLALFAGEPDLAWDQFMQRYGVQMMRWLQRREDCVDTARDCWLQTCERLAADRYRRLRNVQLSAQRPTLWPWLQAVMNSGLVNAFWARLGRTRVPAKVTELGADEVTLYGLMINTGGHARSTLDLAARSQPERPAADWMLAWERLQQSLSGRDRSRMLALHLRRHGRQLVPNGLEQIAANDADPAEAADMAQLDDRLRRSLQSLNSRQRLAVQLRFEQELPHAAIGAAMGVGESGVRHLLRQAIAQLQRHMHGGRQ